MKKEKKNIIISLVIIGLIAISFYVYHITKYDKTLYFTPSKQISNQELEESRSIIEYRLELFGFNVAGSEIKDGRIILKVSEQEIKDKDQIQEFVYPLDFEAKIDNQTIFSNGKEDITFVCRNDGSCAGIRDCYQTEGGYYCKFQIQIRLTEEAAEIYAETTKDLEINMASNGAEVLSKPIDFYLDGTLVDSLLISSELKGVNAQDILISGPGTGSTQEDAIRDSLNAMYLLQNVLIAGKLPCKFEVSLV